MISITKAIFFCFYCRRSWYLYIVQDVCFYFAKKEILLLLFVQLRKSPGKSWNFDAKSSGKTKKKSWKVLEFESVF